MTRPAPAELRVVPWLFVLAPVSLGSAVLVTSSLGVLDGPGPHLVWPGLGVLAAGAVMALDEPAAAVVASVPVTRRTRTLQRLLVPLALVAGWIGFALVAATVEPSLSAPALALTGAGIILLATAAADALRRLGHDEPGTATATAICLSVLGLMLFRLPGDLVLLQAHEVSGRGAVAWAVLGALAVGALLWSTDDPARRPRALRPAARPRPGLRPVG